MGTQTVTSVTAQVLHYCLKHRVLSATTKTRLVRGLTKEEQEARKSICRASSLKVSCSSSLISDFRAQLCCELHSISLNTQVLSFGEYVLNSQAYFVLRAQHCASTFQLQA